ncbi:hypothetical protein PENSPDRAFT_757560 [Peniophora sp. CONT]|nr:hypothetical protein PENSPDRAFT_757560 [Peniophora sp. CONT]
MSPNESDMEERAAQAKFAWFSLLDSRIPPEGHGSSGCGPAELDVELQVLDELVLSARRRRNAHVAWPCKLPFEVLALILAEVKRAWGTSMTRYTEEDELNMEDFHGDDWRTIVNTAERNHVSLGWLNVTFVCDQIRKVALASPSLWSEIECSQITLSFKDEMVLRSAEQPLHLALDYDYDSLERCIEWTGRWLTPAICSRLRSLELRNFSEDIHKIFESMHILSKLTGVTLQCARNAYDTIPRTILNVELPLTSPQLLSRLTFIDCFPPASNSMFSSHVTDLTLSFTMLANSPSVPSVDELLWALSSLTQLERLRLDNVLRKIDQSSSTVHTLPPSFRKLEYRVGSQRLAFAPVVDLMTRIELPRGVQVILGYDVDGDDGGCIDGISDFARDVGATFRATRTLPGSPWSLHLAHHEAHVLLGDEYPTLQSMADTLSVDGITTTDSRICLSRLSTTHLTIGDLNGLFQLLPLSHLSSLSLDKQTIETLSSESDSDEEDRARRQMIDKLLTAPALRHLLLSMGWSINATHLFAKLAEVRNQDGRDIPLVFPLLETLTIGVEIQLGVDGDVESRAKELLAPISAALDTVVNARRNCARPVSEARIERRLKYTYAWEVETKDIFRGHLRLDQPGLVIV